MDERERWVLKRLDDNGREVEVRRFDKRAEAEAAAKEFEERGHKQTYWVEAVTSPGA
ncbi:MAG: hypothetical protein K8T20_00965 [Planctomycetes bacterium]|nr:hypothetical protein [Planctomycetota bacterium]